MEISLNEKDQQNLISKSNELVEARYKLSLTEQRIILTVISKIQPHDEGFKKYRFKIAEFLEFIGINRPAVYKNMLQITKNLMEKVLTIKKDNKLHLTHWVQTATYEIGSGCVDLTFDPELKPYLLGLKNCFLKYKLKDVIRLKSTYSIRLYELLKQYKKIGKRTFEIEALKKILGIEPNKYKLYADFKKKVIEVAQKELSAKTDIAFEFKKIKESRKVKGILFVIKNSNINPSNNSAQALIESTKEQVPEIPKKELYQRLINYFCLSPAQAEEILKTCPEDHILANLSYIEEKYKKGEITRNIGSYTMKALRDDFTHRISFFDIEKQETEAKEQEEKLKKQQWEQLKKKYDKYLKKAIEEYKNSLSSDEWKQIEKQIMAEVEEKHGENHIGKGIFVKLSIENYIKEKAGLPAFEKWLEKQTG